MTTKDYGAGVSGYLDPEGRNWETTTFQASKPVLDKELNLTQDTQQLHEQRLRSRTFPSGWVAADFMDTSSSTSGIFTPSVNANELEIPQDLLAFVNGWQIKVASTGATSTNVLDLGAGPAGAGAKRTDLVILEVWRRLLSASPSADGKSPAGRIWLNGNVKIAASDDVALNFADDILDGAVGSETTKRVQIQYRLRVVTGVDVFSNPYGIDDPIVVANSVPTAPASPDGLATLFTYTNQSAAGDPGLWRAGDGSPANTIGSVDGYMYAIPLMAVIRRNTSAFDRNTNHNGGVADPGPSDRPDGLVYDILVDRDIIDLRHGVNPAGWDFNEILEKNYQYLLDNTLRSEITTTLIGGGVHGNTVLTADEIGISNAHGGDSVTTGDTPGAVFIGEFDSVRRFFSDRAVIETMVLEFTPADGSGGGPNWANNDTITIDPTSLPIYPTGTFNWAAYAPADTFIIGLDTDALDQYGDSNREAIRYIGQSSSDVQAKVGDDFVFSGAGAVPMTSMTLDIGTVPAGVTDESLYVRLRVMYPAGVGLTKTPTDDFGTDSVVINNPGQLPAGSPVLYDQLENTEFDYPHRELFLTYRTVDRVITFSGPDAGEWADTIFLPERCLSVSNIDINGGPYGGAYTISDDGYLIRLDSASLGNGDYATITYKAVRPLPQNDEQLTIYYETRAPQTSRDALLPSSLGLIPRAVADKLTILTVGSGSQDEAYPFPYQYVQMPGVYPTSGGTWSGDHLLNSDKQVALAATELDTGYQRSPALIGYVPNPQEAIFERTGGDIDSEGRSFYKEVPTTAYIPNAIAEPLNLKKPHRVLLPMVAELTADSSLGRKGQLVLAVFGAIYGNPPNSPKTFEVVGDNSFGFDSDLSLNVTSVSIYRLKGQLLNNRPA